MVRPSNFSASFAVKPYSIRVLGSISMNKRKYERKLTVFRSNCVLKGRNQNVDGCLSLFKLAERRLDSCQLERRLHTVALLFPL